MHPAPLGQSRASGENRFFPNDCPTLLSASFVKKSRKGETLSETEVISEQLCRHCAGPIPPKTSNLGRPRTYCSFHCRREYNRALERRREQGERAEREERWQFESDKRFHGVREAERRAKQRQKNREQWVERS